MAMLYRWDHETEQWAGTSLRVGQQLRLNDRAMVVRQATTLHCLFVSDGATVTVNGLPALPVRVLADRDEIRTRDEIIYFSAEAPPEVRAFAAEGPVSCGRCKGQMNDGDPAVRCPRCRAWHHQSKALPCWAYDPRCSVCDQPTTGVSWQPEPLRRSRGRA